MLRRHLRADLPVLVRADGYTDEPATVRELPDRRGGLVTVELVSGRRLKFLVEEIRLAPYALWPAMITDR